MSLKKLLLVAVLIASVTIAGQVADEYDTLFTRANKQILVPKYDTVKQLDRANEKADQILSDLEVIKRELNINDTIK